MMHSRLSVRVKPQTSVTDRTHSIKTGAIFSDIQRWGANSSQSNYALKKKILLTRAACEKGNFNCSEQLFLTIQTLKIKTHAALNGESHGAAGSTGPIPQRRKSRSAEIRQHLKGLRVTMEREQSRSNVWEE